MISGISAQGLGYFLGPCLCFLSLFTQGLQLVGDGAVQGGVGSEVRMDVPVSLCKLRQVSAFWSFFICKVGLKQHPLSRVVVKMKGTRT